MRVTVLCAVSPTKKNQRQYAEWWAPPHRNQRPRRTSPQNCKMELNQFAMMFAGQLDTPGNMTRSGPYTDRPTGPSIEQAPVRYSQPQREPPPVEPSPSAPPAEFSDANTASALLR